jgi:hypothetical protein
LDEGSLSWWAGFVVFDGDGVVDFPFEDGDNEDAELCSSGYPCENILKT